MLRTNCEMFACFCKTGVRPAVSRQVVRGVTLGISLCRYSHRYYYYYCSYNYRYCYCCCCHCCCCSGIMLDAILLLQLHSSLLLQLLLFLLVLLFWYCYCSASAALCSGISLVVVLLPLLPQESDNTELSLALLHAAIACISEMLVSHLIVAQRYMQPARTTAMRCAATSAMRCAAASTIRLPSQPIQHTQELMPLLSLFLQYCMKSHHVIGLAVVGGASAVGASRALAAATAATRSRTVRLAVSALLLDLLTILRLRCLL
jgi:hypothetical protein